jgi:ribonuclease J
MQKREDVETLLLKEKNDSSVNKVSIQKQNNYNKNKDEAVGELKIIPLGGLGDIGCNMMLLEFQKKIVIIDLGLFFPDEDTPGVDYIIPNISYLIKRKKDIVGIIITHGHLDHIGAIPYLIKDLGNPPIFTGEFSRRIILKRQEDFSRSPKLNITTVHNRDIIDLSPFKIEFFSQNHSIPDNFGCFITTPIGNIIHTSDFKFDNNPINEKPTDYKRLQDFSRKNVLLLMSSSTNAEEKGHSLSEGQVIVKLEEIFQQAKGRIVVATFASLINRIQQIISLSRRYNRKIVIEGYSMKSNIEIMRDLGYLQDKSGDFITTKNMNKYSDNQLTLLCTGAQGEDNAVLSRIINKKHKSIRLQADDTVIFSSSVIPGNEATVQSLKNSLYRQTTNVFHYKMMDIHSSGHGKIEELKKMINLTKPKFFLPIHGCYFHLVSHAKLAVQQGIPEKNVIVASNGEIVCLSAKKIYVDPRKKVKASYVMVDGLGVGNMEKVVLRDRQNLSNDGILVIVLVFNHDGKLQNSPDIISRGFVYLRNSQKLLQDVRKRVVKIVKENVGSEKSIDIACMKNQIRDDIGDFLFTQTGKRPMVLSTIIKV